jgi:hypothetical protein
MAQRDWIVALIVQTSKRRSVRRASNPMDESAARELYCDLAELGAKRPGIGGAELLRLRQRGGMAVVDSVRFG